MPKGKILVVEDEAITANDIADTLTAMDYQVIGIANNGEDALRLAEAYRPDLALMDIVIKGHRRGTDVALEMKNRLNVPVVYLSAFTDQSTLLQAQKAEPLGYLSKPFNEQDLRATVEMALYKAKMEAERRELVKQLQEALAHIKTLSGMIPICASCKKIRDDKGYWESVESYISQHSEAEFTHSICPECTRKLYPELYEELQA